MSDETKGEISCGIQRHYLLLPIPHHVEQQRGRLESASDSIGSNSIGS